MQKVVQIWQHNTNKHQIRVLNVVNKVVVAEMVPTKQPLFLTTIDLEECYKMVELQNTSENKSAINH